MDSNNQLALLATKLDNSVVAVMDASGLNGFARTFMLASAAKELKTMLTKEYMAPIMELQGNKLGFKTDKDSAQGYSEDVVKNCLIEAVLTGVQPFGNQFNIIAGNCYITKEGCGHLLSKVPGLRYSIVPSLPRIKDESAAVVIPIRWSINGGEQREQELDVPIKVNKFMGADAVIGKATRKARAWLYNEVSNNGVEIGDGDVEDVDHTVVSSKTNKHNPVEAAQMEENNRILNFINQATSPEQLDTIKDKVPEDLKSDFTKKMAKLLEEKG